MVGGEPEVSVWAEWTVEETKRRRRTQPMMRPLILPATTSSTLNRVQFSGEQDTLRTTSIQLS